MRITRCHRLLQVEYMPPKLRPSREKTAFQHATGHEFRTDTSHNDITTKGGQRTLLLASTFEAFWREPGDGGIASALAHPGHRSSGGTGVGEGRSPWRP